MRLPSSAKIWARALAVPALLLGLAPAALATTIVNTSGQVQIVTPGSVLKGAMQSDLGVSVFAENSDIVLSVPLAVDVITSGVYTSKAGLTPGAIPAGTAISDFFVHSDPLTPGSHFSGSITFSNDIIGIVALDATLSSTDAIIGLKGMTDYSAPWSGLELNGQDQFTVSQDLRTLSFSVMTWDCTDDIRVITSAVTGVQNLSEASTPEPDTWVMVLGGLGTLALFLRHRMIPAAVRACRN